MSQSSTKSQSGTLTRRQALKVLAATTGAMVLSNLPQTWKTPMVEVGMLPAHAQGASGPPPTISQLKTGGCSYGELPIALSFQYQDPLGQVNNNSMVHGTYNYSDGTSFSEMFGGPVNGSGGSMNGTSFAGLINFPFNSDNCMNNSNVFVRLTVGGRQSNVLNGTINVANVG
jgi:hypothetical protein